jgi:hypothetical protein
MGNAIDELKKIATFVTKKVIKKMELCMLVNILDG